MLVTLASAVQLEPTFEALMTQGCQGRDFIDKQKVVRIKINLFIV
jgi:hypothetical protein